MENAAEALKMAGAALLFVLAFSITMYMVGKAKTTTDAVLDNLNIDNFFDRVEPLENNTTRKVGIETIIPTIYRYGQSDASISVRILDKNGNELQIFDSEIEGIANTYFKGANGEISLNAAEENYNYYKYLAEKYGVSTKDAYLYGAPWANQNQSYKMERINAYIYGTPSIHMPDIYKNSTNTLIQYKGSTFTESYLEYRYSGTVKIDDYGEEIVVVPASTKTIITYQLTN